MLTNSNYNSSGNSVIETTDMKSMMTDSIWNDHASLEEAKSLQSHYIDEKGVANVYNGCDKWEIGHIKAGTKFYVLVADPFIKNLDKGEVGSYNFFFDEKTFNKYFNDRIGKFDSMGLSQAVQVNPFYDVLKEQAVYRKNVLCFIANTDFRTPVGVCQQNNQFGGGGGHQAYISFERFDDMIKNGDLTYSEKDSYIDKAYNYELSETEYDHITTIRDKRVEYCKDNNKLNPSHNLFKKGFSLNKIIPGTFENINFRDIIKSFHSAESVAKSVFSRETKTEKKLNKTESRKNISMTSNNDERDYA